jgi:transposase-like protein
MANKAVSRTQKGQSLPLMSDEQAREHLEKLRWPNGPICVHCSGTNVTRLNGQASRPGTIQCNECRQQFTVTIGTIFEDSHIPLAKWVMGFHLMVSSKKGVSALQLKRNLGLGSYQTAWHMAHRIRYAMSNPDQPRLQKEVQVDETYVGGKPRPGSPNQRGKGITKKTPVMAMVETGGLAVSQPLDDTKARTMQPIMQASIDQSARIVTDEKPSYLVAAKGFSGGHSKVNHRADEWVNDEGFTTNTAESFFSLLKRGHYGVYHQMSKQHLHRYCAEFDFRWNARTLSDTDRRTMALLQTEGKRLMYRQPLS